ncbi:hypothetical protein V6N13_094113 [Hibiscus sabdariffa]
MVAASSAIWSHPAQQLRSLRQQRCNSGVDSISLRLNLKEDSPDRNGVSAIMMLSNSQICHITTLIKERVYMIKKIDDNLMDTESFSTTPISETSKLGDEAPHADHADHEVPIVPSESNHVAPPAAADPAVVSEAAASPPITTLLSTTAPAAMPIPTADPPL